MKDTPQDYAVDALVCKGWRVDHRDEDTVYLSKRGKVRGQTLYCQVAADGEVGGAQ